MTSLAPEAWTSNPALAASVYELLCAAHYRTSPLDLRRMMDAPGQHFAVAQTDSVIAGALWLVEEGGLTAQLSRAVWAGSAALAGTWWRSPLPRMAAPRWRQRSKADG